MGCEWLDKYQGVRDDDESCLVYMPVFTINRTTRANTTRRSLKTMKIVDNN